MHGNFPLFMDLLSWETSILLFFLSFSLPTSSFHFHRLPSFPFYQQPSSLPYITNHSPHSLNLEAINHVKIQARGPSRLVHERCQTHSASQLHCGRSQGSHPSPLDISPKITPKLRTKQTGRLRETSSDRRLQIRFLSRRDVSQRKAQVVRVRPR